MLKGSLLVLPCLHFLRNCLRQDGKHQQRRNIVIMRKYIIGSVITIGIFISSCGDFWGSHGLGNKLTLLEGDRTEDRIIVYCTGYSGGACIAGIPVIPSRKDTNTLYVDVAKSNSDWLIAKSIRLNKQTQDYWIISKAFNIANLNCETINCDSILQSKVIGPLSITDFSIKREQLKIDLNF